MSPCQGGGGGRRRESRVSLTTRWLRRSSLTSRSTAHIDAVVPSSSRTGSPIMCTVRTAPSGCTTRNSPSMGRASTRQSVTIAVSFGRSSVRTRDGSSSRLSGTEAGSRPRIRKSSPDHSASSVSRFHSALPTRLSREPGRGAGAGPSRNWARCASRSVSWCSARSYSARCQRPLGSAASSWLSRRTASTSPRSRRACVMSASTEPGPGGRAAGWSAERGDDMTHSDVLTVRPRRNRGWWKDRYDCGTARHAP